MSTKTKNKTTASKQEEPKVEEKSEVIETNGPEEIIFNIENGINNKEIIVDPVQSFEAMKLAQASAQPKMFELVEFPIEDLTINDVGWNPRTKKPVQNIEFEYNGEERRMAIENPYFFNLLRVKIQEFADAEEGAEIIIPLPIDNIIGKKLQKQKDGGYWLN